MWFFATIRIIVETCGLLVVVMCFFCFVYFVWIGFTGVCWCLLFGLLTRLVCLICVNWLFCVLFVMGCLLDFGGFT